MSEVEVGVMEVMDFDQLINSINEAMNVDPLATSILWRLDSPTCLEGWELVNRMFWFQNWHYIPDQGTL